MAEGGNSTAGSTGVNELRRFPGAIGDAATELELLENLVTERAMTEEPAHQVRCPMRSFSPRNALTRSPYH